MSEMEKGELKDAEVKVGCDDDDDDKVPGLELLRVDNMAKQYFEFALPTWSRAQDAAKLLGRPDRKNLNLQEHPMEPFNIPRDWMQQKRITLEKDGCSFFLTMGHYVCSKESAACDKVQIHNVIRQRIKEL